MAKNPLSSDQLKEVDQYLGKLVHAQEDEGPKICPACLQPIVEQQGGPGHALLVVTGKSSGVYISLTPGKVCVIGRGTATDIRLEDGLASRKHAAISGHDGFSVINDLGSANGTYVNGNPVKSKQLGKGDVITIGGTRLIFSTGGGED